MPSGDEPPSPTPASGERFGEYLCQQGVITRAQLDETLKHQGLYGARLGTNLLDQGIVQLPQLSRLLSAYHGVALPPRKWLMQPQRAAINRASRSAVETIRFVPLQLEGALLHAAVLDPRDPVVIDELRFATGCRIEPYVLPEAAMHDLLYRLWKVPIGIRPVHADASTAVPRGSDPAPDEAPGAGEPTTDSQADLTPALGTQLGAVRQLQLRSIGGQLAAHTQRETTDANRINIRDTLRPAASVPPPPFSPIADAPLPELRPLTNLAASIPPPPIPMGALEVRAPRAESPEPPTPLRIAALERELLEVNERDRLLELSLELAGLFAERAALFVLHPNYLQCHGVVDTGGVRLMHGRPIDLGEACFLTRMLEQRSGARVQTGDSLADANVLVEVPGARAGAAAVFPVTIKDRLVNLIYADAGDAPLAVTSFGALDALTRLMTLSYEYLIVRRKAGR
ncbi:MAG: hypothetical protein OEZ06_10560 [Myxococcales bacterium]|nr:hypothetical protein [Myxococcales bacterium]